MSAVFLPISEISAYTTKWTIKARVTNKGPTRTFRKGTGEGKVFHVDLLDESGSDIRASFFNEAVDKFENMLQLKKCYTFSKGRAKVANKQYNNTSHRYELTFEADSLITEVANDDNIKQLSKFQFVDFGAIANKPVPCLADVCGVVTAFGPTTALTAKDGRELVKRDVTLADDTASTFLVTLWGDFAKIEDKKFEGQPVVGIKSVNIKEFNGGKSGSTLDRGAVVFEPEGAVADRLRSWWRDGGSTQGLTSISSVPGASGGARTRNAQHCELAAMRAAADDSSEQAAHFCVVSRLAIVQTKKQGEVVPLYYKACGEPREGTKLTCNRRVDEGGYCPSCGRNSATTNMRMNIRCRYSDFRDSVWLTTFHEAAEQVTSMTAEEMDGFESKENGREILEASLKQRYFADPVQITVRSKLETYNGEPRVNMSCVDARVVNRREHGRVLLQDIQQMLGA